MSQKDHECDLFLMSSHRAYEANNALAEFARRGSRNIHGWGIGSYAAGGARVLRSEIAATEGTTLSREFSIAIQAVSSPVILGHLRLTSRGATRIENNHPFTLHFLGCDWLCIHNGSATVHEQLVPPAERLIPGANSDTPRIFEFLRKWVLDYVSAGPSRSLIEAFRAGFEKLLEADPKGKFNLIISNGHLSFVFVHWRPFYLLHREKGPGDAALISTLKLTDHEAWITFERLPNRKAKMLVFSGPTLVFNADVPKDPIAETANPTA
jgi:predicted glutamine amidotransferase